MKAHRYDFLDIPQQARQAARTAVEVSLKIQKDERMLIITNPLRDVFLLSAALHDACLDAGGIPVLLVQPQKSQLDFAEDAVYQALRSSPEVIVSMSANKMGKDRFGLQNAYLSGTSTWDNYFHYLLHGEKTTRSFWAPGTTLESFSRTVDIDYALMKKRAAWLKGLLDKAVNVRITSPSGTDISFSLQGRFAKLDDGDFSVPGTGGNLPAGEAFISPVLDSAQGVIAFDGSISTAQGTLLIKQPIFAYYEGGYIGHLEGGSEADVLNKTLEDSATKAHEFEKSGNLKSGQGEIYARNAYGLGELGIGINEKAKITGNMLEDEKAFHTCHMAIGANYDEDQPALNHLDGLVQKPTITLSLENGQDFVIMRDGNLQEG